MQRWMELLNICKASVEGSARIYDLENRQFQNRDKKEILIVKKVESRQIKPKQMQGA